jgi:cytochrome c-type biogenesis protein
MSGLPEVIVAGSMPAAVLVAAAAGLISFASPCVLPLVPGYLGYVTGLTGVDLGRQRRGRLAAGSTLFVLGFTAVFVVIFASASALTRALVGNQEVLLRYFGVLVVLLGLLFAGVLPGAGRAFTPSWRPVAGLAGAPLLGVVFGLGWSPCTSPTLGAVLLLATGDGGGATRGVLLAVAYGLGLGLPFVLVAVGYGRAARALSVLRRHQRGLRLAGSGLLVLLGVLMISGVWVTWTTRLSTVVLGWSLAV